MIRYLQSVLLLLLCCLPLTVAAQNEAAFDTILFQRLSLQRKLFPQEKFHVMTDAELYHPGDTIWMRIWVQDGLTLQDSHVGSNFVYAELRDGIGKLVKRVKIRTSGGHFSGHLILPRDQKTGGYTLIAYTQYMTQVPDRFMFRKPIYILSQIDELSGFTARPLIEKKCPARRLVPSQGQITSRGDTLTRVTFQAPANTWLSVSVTDDELTPIDTALLLNRCLPAIAPLFNEESLSGSNHLYKPEIPVEKTCSLDGKIQFTKTEDIEITAVNLTNQDIFFTKPDKDGKFVFQDIDLPENTRLSFTAFRKGRYTEAMINLYEQSLPLHLPVLQTDPRNYFVNLKKNKDTIVVDHSEFTLLPAAEVVAKEGNKRHSKDEEYIKWIIKQKWLPDDQYTQLATKTIYFTQFPKSGTSYLVSHVVSLFDGITVEDSVAYWQDKEAKDAKRVPVCFVFNQRQVMNQVDANGKVQPQKALRYPHSCIYALDFIAPDQARRLNEDTEFKDSPIIRLDFNGENDFILGQNRYVAKVSGYQQPLIFQNIKIRRELIRTRYWNPVMNSGSGQVTIDLPLPADHHTTYTLRAEGVSPNGQPFSYVGRIKM